MTCYVLFGRISFVQLHAGNRFVAFWPCTADFVVLDFEDIDLPFVTSCGSALPFSSSKLAPLHGRVSIALQQHFSIYQSVQQRSLGCTHFQAKRPQLLPRTVLTPYEVTLKPKITHNRSIDMFLTQTEILNRSPHTEIQPFYRGIDAVAQILALHVYLAS